MDFKIGDEVWYYYDKDIPYNHYPHEPKKFIITDINDNCVGSRIEDLNMVEYFDTDYITRERPTERYKEGLKNKIEDFEREITQLKESLQGENKS